MSERCGRIKYDRPSLDHRLDIWPRVSCLAPLRILLQGQVLVAKRTVVLAFAIASARLIIKFLRGLPERYTHTHTQLRQYRDRKLTVGMRFPNPIGNRCR